MNRAGLSTISYRVGTHGPFKESMLAALSTLPSLRHLTTRRDEDLGIALLDSWALVLDVLTFYQERIANEGFLRTAEERRSLLELARTIGYELRPGVAASTHLAFTLDGNPGSPEEIVLPTGTRAQSIPGQDELPQPFETSDDLVARPEWSTLKPRLTRPQIYDATTRRFLLRGTGSQLTPGDRTLLVISAEVQVPLTVVSVTADAASDTTVLITESIVCEAPEKKVAPKAATSKATFQEVSSKEKLDAVSVEANFSKTTWSQQAWTSYAKSKKWSPKEVAKHLKAKKKKAAQGAKPATEPAPRTVTPGLFALRSRSGIFGHNAQQWDSTPVDWRVDRPGSVAPFKVSWEGNAITENAIGGGLPEGVIYLERNVPEILGESWIVLQDGTETPLPFRIERADDESIADYGLSAKVTRLRLEAIRSDLASLSRRGTTAFAQSEELSLAPLPIESVVAGNLLELDEVELRLEAGRLVTVRGERADLEGVETAEIAEIEEILQVQGVTQLKLTKALVHSYVRSTVALNINTVAATHGETRTETLGSGDAASAFQRFILKQAPLTYTAAPVPSGGVSTLELRVNGVRWQEADSFFGLEGDARSYVLRRADSGSTSVVFGDGRRGSRLPTGIENLRAVYRTGIGMVGQMDRDRITLLASRPLGVRDVTNPVAAENAEDPESRDQARSNAPLTVRTLDRIVSLMDFEDFARAFSGIGKARADRLWDGSRRVVHLTLAAADGGPVSSTLEENLRLAMDRVRDLSQPLLLGSFDALFFQVAAKLKIDADFLPEVVLSAAQEELERRFSFDQMDFAKRVPKSEVLAVLQRVEGVIAVDLQTFAYSPDPDPTASASVPPRVLDALPARRVRKGQRGEIFPAQLLTLADGPAALEVMP